MSTLALVIHILDVAAGDSNLDSHTAGGRERAQSAEERVAMGRHAETPYAGIQTPYMQAYTEGWRGTRGPARDGDRSTAAGRPRREGGIGTPPRGGRLPPPRRGRPCSTVTRISSVATVWGGRMRGGVPRQKGHRLWETQGQRQPTCCRVYITSYMRHAQAIMGVVAHAGRARHGWRKLIRRRAGK